MAKILGKSQHCVAAALATLWVGVCSEAEAQLTDRERNYDGTTTTRLMTLPLWGVGSTPPYGHDGRSINLREVILRHGGEAKRARDKFAALSDASKAKVTGFLETLVLFPPDDTASNLDPGDPTNPAYPQAAHGSIKLGVLFNDPTEAE